jgi:hypothetical protein
MSLRTLAILAAFALLAWVGFEIGRAGSDVPAPRIQSQSTLSGGAVNGKRIDGRAWSIDYDTVTMSPDASYATIAHVRDGRIHRPGKSDVRVQATDVTVNTVTNDLTVRGRVRFVEPLGKGRTRTFESVGATYVGASHTLILDHPSTITDDGATVTVANARVDFRSGEAVLGRIVGTRPGKQS